jgi:hypothetical protein
VLRKVVAGAAAHEVVRGGAKGIALGAARPAEGGGEDR